MDGPERFAPAIAMACKVFKRPSSAVGQFLFGKRRRLVLTRKRCLPFASALSARVGPAHFSGVDLLVGRGHDPLAAGVDPLIGDC